MIIQGVRDEKTYFERLSNAIVDQFGSDTLRSTTWLGRVWSRVGKINLSMVGVEMKDDTQSTPYLSHFIDVASKVSSEEQRLVLLIDEFPEAVQNIITDHGKDAAIKFLQLNRELREDARLKHVCFVLTGSIGMEDIASKLNKIDLINDLEDMRVNPLKRPEAHDFVTRLIGAQPFDLSDDLIDLILDKIKWFSPYYIQIVVKTLVEQEETPITRDLIECVFREIPTKDIYFKHWLLRLFESTNNLQDPQYVFSKTVLNRISQNDHLEFREIKELAGEQNLEPEIFKSWLNKLVHDGYIKEDEDRTCRFYLPLLQQWWLRNVSDD